MVLKDYTNEFSKMLLENAKWPDLSPGILIEADRNWGKSCQGFQINTMLLIGNPKRRIKIYRAPEKILTEINKSFPKALAKRFGLIDDVWDVDKNDVIYVDEAGMILDGKDALTKPQKEFIKGLTHARHHHSPVICCTVHPGVSKHLKVLSEFKIFRHMNWDHVKTLMDLGDPFIRRYGYILEKIPIEKSIFRSNYTYFRDSKNELIYQGGLFMPKDRFCPFYTQEISENMGNENLATMRHRDMEQKLNLEPIVLEVIDYYGNELRKGCRNALIHGWFQRHKPEEYQKFQPFIKDIGYQALTVIFERKQNQIAPVREKIYVPTTKNTSGSFIDFLEKFYVENLPAEIHFNQKTSYSKETIIEVLIQWSEGLGQRNIDVSSDNRNKRIPISIIGKILKAFRDGNGIIQDDLRLYNVYEHWIAKLTGGKVISGIGNVDILYEFEGKKYPGECKFYDDISVSIAMDKTKKLKASLDYCREHDIDVFPLFFRNVKWGDEDYLFEVFVDGPDIANIKKLEDNIMADTFNPVQFYNLEVEI